MRCLGGGVALLGAFGRLVHLVGVANSTHTWADVEQTHAWVGVQQTQAWAEVEQTRLVACNMDTTRVMAYTMAMADMVMAYIVMDLN